MRFPFVPRSVLRRAARVAAVLAALAATGFVAVATLMYFWLLPNIAEHRDAMANLMSRALGLRVTLESVSGVWQQARPEFHLQGVRLHDAEGRLALELPSFEAEFAWRSLLFLEPRFSRIELRGLVLDARRTRDGRFYVGGIPINPADPDSGFSNWLLRQGRVHVEAARLVWHDDQRDAPPLVFEAVDLRLDNSLREHRLRGRATPPPELARPLGVDAELSGRIADPRTWNGNIAVEVAGVSFPRLATWLDVPWQPRAGWGALRANFGVRAGRLAGIGAGIDLRAVEIGLAAQTPPLRLERVRGQALWRRDATSQRIEFENLRVAWKGTQPGAPFSVGFAWGAQGREISARAFELNGWKNMLPSLPIDAALRARLAALDPRGRFDILRLAWRGNHPGPDNFEIDARFSGLGMAAEGARPGFENLRGHVEGDARGGRFTIDARRLALDMPQVFREPIVRFDEMRAAGNWKKTAHGQQLALTEAAFSNPDFAGSAQGGYEWNPGTRGKIDLTAHLTRADGMAVQRYLPKVLGEATVGWVRQGVLAGRSDDTRLVLRGDLARFPFDSGDGLFRVEAHIKDATIRYVPGWPVIEDLDARMVFAGRSMEIVSERARIYDVVLAPVRATIPDLLHHEEELRVAGEARGPTQDFIRFANFSPVGEHLLGLTEALDGTGTMRLGLNLRVPLRHSHDTTLAGRLGFLGGTLFPPAMPRIEQVRGDIEFTHDNLSARLITAQMLGGPVRVEAQTRNGQVRLLAQGRVTAAGLAPWLGARIGSRLSGQTNWRGQVDFQPEGERIRLESDLVGLASALPAPLSKLPQQTLPLVAAVQPLGDDLLNEVRLGRVVGGLWRNNKEGRFERGEIRFGGMATIPEEAGLRLAGSARGLDISGWASLLPESAGNGGGGGEGVSISSIDLGFDAFDMMGRRFQGVRLQGRTRNGLLRTQVSGREVSGMLTYRPAGKEPARVSAQFRQLVIPAALPATAGADDAPNMKAADFPVLDLTVDDFRVQERALGKLKIVARGEAGGLVIDMLEIEHPDSVLRMKGLWRDVGAGETRADIDLTVHDAGGFLTRFGYPDTLRRGSAKIAGKAAWDGSPADFAFVTLAGQLDFKAQGGQFLAIKPGAGKLLGVLSLQSLPRRLNFDFRDIFNSGFAFDDIEATLRIARGVVYSDDFRMRGPAAKVNMSGLADLNQESVQLRVKVIPKLSEGVAVAGALLGGPIAGVGALAAQKLLRDPLEEVISKEYMVTGPWLAPDVARLNNPPAGQLARPSEH